MMNFMQDKESAYDSAVPTRLTPSGSAGGEKKGQAYIVEDEEAGLGIKNYFVPYSRHFFSNKRKSLQRFAKGVEFPFFNLWL